MPLIAPLAAGGQATSLKLNLNAPIFKPLNNQPIIPMDQEGVQPAKKKNKKKKKKDTQNGDQAINPANSEVEAPSESNKGGENAEKVKATNSGPPQKRYQVKNSNGTLQ